MRHARVLRAVNLRAEWTVNNACHSPRPDGGVQGTVVLHQFGRSRNSGVPNMSPFCLKLETFLRFAKVPYVVSKSQASSDKGKMPWIELDGQIVSDSALCMRFIRQQLGRSELDRNTPAEVLATAMAARVMCEEHLSWALVYARWIDPSYGPGQIFKVSAADDDDDGSSSPPPLQDLVFNQLPFPFSKIVPIIAHRRVWNNLHYHGLGRHSKEDIYAFARDDLNALSTMLGTRPFFGGDALCTEDMGIFGVLASIYYPMPDSPVRQHLRSPQCSNLAAYVERVCSQLWPDWGEIASGKLRALEWSP
jgi:glutathione S-transferase